jgi:hypothetical protein
MKHAKTIGFILIAIGVLITISSPSVMSNDILEDAVGKYFPEWFGPMLFVIGIFIELKLDELAVEHLS